MSNIHAQSLKTENKETLIPLRQKNIPNKVLKTENSPKKFEFVLCWPFTIGYETHA